MLGPVLTVTLFSAAVAAASILYGKEVGLTNNVVPLLSVVVALLLGESSHREATRIDQVSVLGSGPKDS